MNTDTAKLQFLVVDDEDIVLDLYVTMLEMIGYSCQTATSGEAAIAILNRQPVDVLVTDASMPGMHGIELLNYCFQESPDTRRILITGDTASLVKAQQLQGHEIVHEVLAKPCDIETFQEAIRNQVNQVPIG